MIREVDNYILSFFSPQTQKQIRCSRSSLVGLSFIAFGPLLPTLRVPDVDLTGKVAIVTGANSGIGLQIASDLAQRNSTVYLACRTRSKAEQAIQSITDKFPQAKDRTHFVQLDTSSLASVRAFAQSWTKTSSDTIINANDDDDAVSSTTRIPNQQIDILVHNAGIAGPPQNQPFTSEGFETTYATNFLGSFLLTHLLQKNLSPTARVVLTSSTAQYSGRISPTFATSMPRDEPNYFEPGFHCPTIVKTGSLQGARAPGFAIYSNTKVMQGAFARLLQQRFNADPGNMKVVHYFTPDLTSTPILGKMGGGVSMVRDFASWSLAKLESWAISVEQGAATGSWLAVERKDPRVIDPSQGGGFWDQMYRLTATPDVMSQDLLDRLWKRWESDAGVSW